MKASKKALSNVRTIAGLTLGIASVAAIACSSQDNRPEAGGEAALPVLSLDAPTTVAAGSPSEREATCPGRRLPDQCGSWAGVELRASRDTDHHGGGSCKHGQGRDKHSHHNDKGHDDKGHGGSGDHDDASLQDSHCLCDAIDFQIPSELPVTSGRSGGDWDKATLTFRKPSGRFVECRYRGNAGGRNRGGDKYLFERCSDGSKAGQTRSADWFELELGDDHPHSGPTEVQLRLGEPDVVDGVVQEQVFYASDPLIAGAALHVPRGSAPPFETFSLDRVAGLPPSTNLENGGNPATTVTHVVDVHSDNTEHFVFTPVPGACPRVELPYNQAALEALVGPGNESAIVAKDLSSTDADSAVLTSGSAVTINLARRTMTFCVEHLSFKAGVVGNFDSNLTGASIRSVDDLINVLPSTGLLTGSLPSLIVGNSYELTLTFTNVSPVANGDWDSGLNLVPVTISSGNAAIGSASTWGLAIPPWVSSAGPPASLSYSTYTSTSSAGSVPHKTASAVHSATFVFNVTVPSSSAPLNFCLRSAGSAASVFGDCFTWDPSGATTPGTGGVPGGTTKACYSGSSATRNQGNCHDGTQTFSAGAWSACEGQVTPTNGDPCGNGDEDCDGSTDEDSSTYYLDRDNDGYGDASATVAACSPPPGYIASAGDCCDFDGNAHPGQTQMFGGARIGCGGFDYNCDGSETKFNEFVGAERSCTNGLCFGCNYDGWHTAVPACGVTTDFDNCGFGPEPCVGSCALFTNIWTIQQTQLCR